MELRTNDPVVSVLAELYDRMDFHTREEDNRSPYNKAYSIISDEIELNGIPTTERAYHLLLVGGIKEKERGIVINSARQSGKTAALKKYEELVNKAIEEIKREKEMNKSMAALLALSALGPGFPGFRRKAPKEPKKPNMALNEEETAKLASLYGKEKKQYVKELKAKYE